MLTQDSTPSWSTRGKLRNHLIPLLREIYGDGCLRNLSMLAHESDEVHALVHQNLYHPFLQAIRRFPGGLVVNILPFISQPQVFWRESLKLLMHSMGMSMVRDKAVGNFVERIQRPYQSSSGKVGLLPGWLELRKGFHTYVTEEGDLYIIRDGILRSNLVVYNPATTKNQLKQSGREMKGHDAHVALDLEEVLKIRYTQPCSDVSKIKALLDGSVEEISFTGEEGSNAKVSYHESILEETNSRDFDMSIVSDKAVEVMHANALLLGPYQVTLTSQKLIRATTDTLTIKGEKKKEYLKFIGDILDGEFAYDISWPVVLRANEANSVEIDLVLLADIIKHLETTLCSSISTSVYDYDVDDVSNQTTALVMQSIKALSVDLKGMDLRLRDGLPHLVPIVHQQADTSCNAKLVIRIAFHYVGSTAHHGH